MEGSQRGRFSRAFRYIWNKPWVCLTADCSLLLETNTGIWYYHYISSNIENNVGNLTARQEMTFDLVLWTFKHKYVVFGRWLNSLMPHMINDIHHLHKGGVAMLCVEGETCNVTSNSDQMVLTLQLNFALRLQNYRKGLRTFSRTTRKVSPECGRETWCKVYGRLVRKLVFKTSQIPGHRHKTHICIFPYELHFQILSLTRNKDKKSA